MRTQNTLAALFTLACEAAFIFAAVCVVMRFVL